MPTNPPYRLGRLKAGRDFINGCIVTDSEIEGVPENSGHKDKEYYGGNLIAESIWRKEDAEFIVRACNSHDALLKACKKALDHLDGCSHGYPDELWETLKNAIEQAESN